MTPEGGRRCSCAAQSNAAAQVWGRDHGLNLACHSPLCRAPPPASLHCGPTPASLGQKALPLFPPKNCARASSAYYSAFTMFPGGPASSASSASSASLGSQLPAGSAGSTSSELKAASRPALPRCNARAGGLEPPEVGAWGELRELGGYRLQGPGR